MALRRLMLVLAALAAPAGAQPIVSSPAPDKVAVTVYRDPHRGLDRFIDTDEDELGGYALVTETRIVDLPPGAVTIRFEGVASGIQPQTMILTGLNPREKNQDRLLLSQRGLLDAFTGQNVTVRRTDRKTGKTTQEPARIRSGPDGVIIETKAGFEALDCTGLNQTLVYPRVPPSLSPKPVLSIAVPDQPGGRRELVLSYLTGNFDWQANYIVDLSADAARADLFAWVTLASLDDTSFAKAQAGVVAGRVAREDSSEERPDRDDEEEKYWIEARCWPSGTTGSPTRRADMLNSLPQLRKPGAERPGEYYGGGFEDGADIMVTGSRIVSQEALGDLKLYRVPFPVTVASRGQKQVAMLSKPGVKGELVYRNRISEGDYGDDPELVFRFQNRKQDGLGESLPTGQVSMFQTMNGRRLLLGETYIDDRAVGEEVELRFPEQDRMNLDVDIEDEEENESGKWTRRRLTVTNAGVAPVLYEAEFREEDDTRFDRFSGRVVRKPGKTVWRVTVPANGKATLRYREVEVDVPDYYDD
jgi:hypothetical protein